MSDSGAVSTTTTNSLYGSAGGLESGTNDLGATGEPKQEPGSSMITITVTIQIPAGVPVTVKQG